MATTDTSGERSRATTSGGTDNIGAGSKLPDTDAPAGETVGPAGDGNARAAQTGRDHPPGAAAERERG